MNMELLQKGVAPELIANAMTKIPRDETEEIRKVIAKKRKKYNDYQMVGYLVRQGFNFQLAKEAVEASHAENYWF